MEAEWKTVPYKKRKNNRQKETVSRVLYNESSQVSDERFTRRSVEGFMKKLKATDFCQETTSRLQSVLQDRHIKKVEEVVCYGLGKPSISRISIYQLALYIIIREFLASDGSLPTSYAYDPAFSRNDIALLKSFNINLIENNEEGKRVVRSPTLFYMVHCDKWLTDNLLSANWSHQRLSKLVIVGNSFDLIFEATPSRILKDECKFLPLVNEWSLFSETLLPIWKEDDTIFNDTSVISFPVKICAKLKKKFLDNTDAV